ncbi:hypothetical protein D3X12_20670 [Pseudomonas protegens]|jgi:predicted component of type VI protein secretion system|uniref:Lipoprotein n=2 Tax=Pseudomonas protegens TaxID=380021 RepID=Q4KC23_PSEF5|nr:MULTISPECIES: hypothetical protein [Pseudomonas]AAY92374.1 conserved hypothetical protein [Pseudomonas protegens Pf-5]ASE23415.1 hypothetical protein CEP86_24210 [Pseudomonas protegens]PNV97905.1 hypothetical protein C1633_12420 [Pseudomonas protegens]QEZ52916.1 hypothetical protein D3X12_20670 [Pseudomonas protegens]QEZ60882.1 hypothetical protein D4N38_31135 [Pseudomonas protegens]
MNCLARGFAALIALVWTSGAAWAGAPEAPPTHQHPLQLAQNLPSSGNNDPYSNPIRRANPNSMQGTQPSSPPVRGPSTAPTGRPPTLENGGIGNGYPRGGVQRPNPDPRVQSPRDSDPGNRR